MPKDPQKTKDRALCGRIEKADESEIQRLAEAVRCVQPLRSLMGSLSRALDALPFPAAIFRQDGVVITANQALLRKAKRTKAEVRSGRVNLLSRVEDENYAVFEAVEGVFFAEASAARDLVRPLSLFARGDGYPALDRYSCAIFCPILEEDGSIAYGMIALTEKKPETEA